MTNIDQKVAEMQKQMESILRHHEVGMETIQVEMQKMRLLMSTIFQLQSEEGSGFVVAAPGVRYGEQHALQLTEGSELVENEEYITESQCYAYFYGLPGVFRVNIPLSRSQDIRIQPVILADPSNPLPPGMALFSHHHNHNIYMVGGQSGANSIYSQSVYVFDPNSFENLPIHPSLLDKPKELHGSFIPMIHPSWIQCEDRIYLLSLCNYFSRHAAPFYFQSFDLTKNHFEILTSPPYVDGQGPVMGFFSLYGYIYLFLRKLIVIEDHFAYIFNIRLSQWKKHNLDRFEELEIPIPSSHFGDVGLSDKFCDKFQILVILNAGGPTAYCIRLCEDGSLRPNSYRLLDEIFIHKSYKTQDDYAHLHDIGQGRFCVVYRSPKMPLLIYAFKVDFEAEHQFQVYGINELNPSSHLLYSKKFVDPIPLWGTYRISTLCLTSTTSNVGGGMAATSSVDKDVEEKDKSKFCLTSTTSNVGGGMAATSSVDKDVEEKDKWPMTSINRNLAEMQKQMELLSQENIHVMESILRHHEVGMETIQRQTEVGMQKMRLLMSTIFQLQSEEGSGFVVAAPGVRYGEQHTLQLTDGSELVENEEYINPESQYYAYFYGRQGLFRFKIPTSRNMGIKIENVILNDPSNPLPHCMALFSHRHNHNIYMVGRQIKYQIEHSDGVYVFDPNRFQNLPIQGLALLDQPKELQDSFIPMIQPSWIQSEDQIYLISVHNHTRYKLLPFYFQSFDLTKNNFKTLEPPPFQEGRRGSVVGFFSLCGYIYLFVEKRSHTWEQFAFIFDPRSSEWKTHTLEHFEERKIPIPSSRIGDVGLSHESTDKSQILVTLNVEGPTAYRVRLCDGLLRPYSSRCLGEIFIHRKYKTDGDYAHLHDIGKGKFCVIFRSRNMPLLIYLFEINFDVEHRIQNALVNASITPSSQVLYSKKYKDPIPLWDMHFFDTLFLASSTSNEGRDMVATSSVDKDLKKNSKSKSRRHRSGGKKSNRNEGRDMAATSSGDKDEQKKDRSILGDIGGEGKNPTQGIKPRG